MIRHRYCIMIIKNTGNMKKVQHKKTFLLLFLLFIAMTTFAQNDKRNQIGEYVQGFIVNNSKDTIHGLIKVENYELSEVRVKFKQRKNGKKTKYKSKKTYKPTELLAYSFKITQNNNSNQIVDKWVHYERKEVDESPRPFASRTVFLERKEEGTINLYLYFVRSNQGVKLKRYFILEHTNSGRTEKVTQKNFDTIVAEFVADCSLLVNRVGRADFTYYNLDSIIYTYNRCLIEAAPN